MNGTFKSVMLAVAKNAVNAALISLAPIIHDHKDYNLGTRAGIEHVAILMMDAILAREFIVWFPVLMKWSSTNGVALMKMMMSVLCVLALCASLGAQASTPTSAFPETTVSFNLSPITLPGLHNSVAGAETDILIAPSSSFELGETTIASSNFVFAGGRINYVIKPISAFIQNHSPNLNGYQFQFGLTGSLGVVKPVGSVGSPHWGERAGVFVNYAVSGTWGMGFDAQWGNFVGVQRNAYTLAFGPNFHF